MKTLKTTVAFLLMMISMSIYAQKRKPLEGNGQIITRHLNIPAALQKITFKDNMAGQAFITGQADSSHASVQVDSNLASLLEMEVKGNQLIIGLKGNKGNTLWIERTNIRIDIALQSVNTVYYNGNGSLSIANLQQEVFLLERIGNGNATISGDVTKFTANNKGNGSINAKNLNAQTAVGSNHGNGSLYINAAQANLSSSGNGRAINIQEEVKQVKTSPLAYVSFKLYNNSGKRQNFKVKGPNPDGSSYGYGFPIGAYAKRKEHFSVGSKVYMGAKVVHVVSVEDEGKVISIF